MRTPSLADLLISPPAHEAGLRNSGALPTPGERSFEDHLQRARQPGPNVAAQSAGAETRPQAAAQPPAANSETEGTRPAEEEDDTPVRSEAESEVELEAEEDERSATSDLVVTATPVPPAASDETPAVVFVTAAQTAAADHQPESEEASTSAEAVEMATDRPKRSERGPSAPATSGKALTPTDTVPSSERTPATAAAESAVEAPVVAAVTAETEAAQNATADAAAAPAVELPRAVSSQESAPTEGTPQSGPVLEQTTGGNAQSGSDDQPQSGAQEGRPASASRRGRSEPAADTPRSAGAGRASVPPFAAEQQIAAASPAAAEPPIIVSGPASETVSTTSDADQPSVPQMATLHSTQVAARTGSYTAPPLPTSVPTGNGADVRANAPQALGSSAAQATPAAEFRPLSDAERVRLVNRVARAMQAAADRGGEMRLRLSPPELGALKMEVAVRDGVLNAHFEAESEAVRGVLMENLPALRDRLAEQNIRLERFDVDVRQSGADGSADQTHGNAQDSSRRDNGPSGKRHKAEDAASTVRTPTPANRGLVDGKLNVIV